MRDPYDLFPFAHNDEDLEETASRDPLRYVCIVANESSEWITFLKFGVEECLDEENFDRSYVSTLMLLLANLSILRKFEDGKVSYILASANDYPAIVCDLLHYDHVSGIRTLIYKIWKEIAWIVHSKKLKIENKGVSPDVLNQLLYSRLSTVPLIRIDSSEIEESWKEICIELVTLLSKYEMNKITVNMHKEYQRARKLESSEFLTESPVPQGLKSQSLELFKILSNKRGEYVTYNSLFLQRDLWQVDEPADSTIEKALKRLKEKLANTTESITIEHSKRRTKLEK